MRALILLLRPLQLKLKTPLLRNQHRQPKNLPLHKMLLHLLKRRLLPRILPQLFKHLQLLYKTLRLQFKHLQLQLRIQHRPSKPRFLQLKMPLRTLSSKLHQPRMPLCLLPRLKQVQLRIQPKQYKCHRTKLFLSRESLRLLQLLSKQYWRSQFQLTKRKLRHPKPWLPLKSSRSRQQSVKLELHHNRT